MRCVTLPRESGWDGRISADAKELEALRAIVTLHPNKTCCFAQYPRGLVSIPYLLHHLATACQVLNGAQRWNLTILLSFEDLGTYDIPVGQMVVTRGLEPQFWPSQGRVLSSWTMRRGVSNGSRNRTTRLHRAVLFRLSYAYHKWGRKLESNQRECFTGAPSWH